MAYTDFAVTVFSDSDDYSHGTQYSCVSAQTFKDLNKSARLAAEFVATELTDDLNPILTQTDSVINYVFRVANYILVVETL